MSTPAQTTEADVVLLGKTERILAFDLLRGFFLLVILVDHIELFPNFFDFFTGKGRLFVSAAEGFFFLSGLLIGMVYKRRLLKGMKFIFKRLWLRAAELYVAAVSLSFVFTIWAVSTGRTDIKGALPNPLDWHYIIRETLLLQFNYSWADFLSRFTLLMIIAPFAFYLVAKGKWWLMLILSIVAWSFRGQDFTLAWQIIFNGGMVIGFYWHSLVNRLAALSSSSRKLLERAVYIIALGTFTLSYASVYVLALLNHRLISEPHWLQHFTIHWDNFNSWVALYDEKWTMGPIRIVLFGFWFATLFLITRKYQAGINRSTRGILELLGRNSLFVYISQAFVVFGLEFWVIPVHTNILQNFLITALGLILLILSAVAYRSLIGRYNLKQLLPAVTNRR